MQYTDLPSSTNFSYLVRKTRPEYENTKWAKKIRISINFRRNKKKFVFPLIFIFFPHKNAKETRGVAHDSLKLKTGYFRLENIKSFHALHLWLFVSHFHGISHQIDYRIWSLLTSRISLLILRAYVSGVYCFKINIKYIWNIVSLGIYFTMAKKNQNWLWQKKMSTV